MPKTDKFKNVSLQKETYSNLDKIRKGEILAPTPMWKTEYEARLLKARGRPLSRKVKKRRPPSPSAVYDPTPDPPSLFNYELESMGITRGAGFVNPFPAEDILFTDNPDLGVNPILNPLNAPSVSSTESSEAED